MQYGIYLTFAVCGAIAMLAIELACLIGRQLKENKNRAQRDKCLLGRLMSLDPQETIILREFFLQDRNTIKLPIESPVVAGLLKEGILQLVQTLSQRCFAGRLASFRLSEAAQAFVTFELLGPPSSENISEADRERIMSERPQFIREITHRERIWEW